jgi:hypothetical protein
MPRIRTIKPEFWSSPGIENISPWARLLYIAMWNWADDTGRGTCHLRELQAFAFPYDEESEDVGTSDGFRRVVAEVREQFGVIFYKVGGRPYYAIPTWNKHQRNERRAKGKHPGPEDGVPWNPTTSDQGSSGTSDTFRHDAAEAAPTVTEAPRTSGPGTGEQGNRGTEEQSESYAPARTREAPPAPVERPLPAEFEVTPDMVAWAQSETPDVDGRVATAKFRDFYTARPRVRCADWTAEWRRWMRREQEFGYARPQQSRHEPDQFHSPADATIARLLGEASEIRARRGEPTDDLTPFALPCGDQP